MSLHACKPKAEFLFPPFLPYVIDFHINSINGKATFAAGVRPQTKVFQVVVAAVRVVTFTFVAGSSLHGSSSESK